jgi:hypoxanthine phosphoribosyltransferase
MTEILDILIPEQRLQARAAALARAIDKDYAGAGLSLVVVLKGAVIFAADLMRHITIPFTVEFASASSYGQSTRSSGTVALAGFERLAMAGQHVLVIEDILDTGATARALVQALHGKGAADVAVVPLLRKPAARTLDLPVPHVGFDIEDDFVVGYGMDLAERYRNLRDIYRLSFGPD